MILRLFNYGREVEITKVNEFDSEGTITDIVWEEEKGLMATYYDSKTEKDKPMPPVKIGSKVSTKLFPFD